MTYLNHARELDRQARPVEAAWAYELSLREPESDLDCYLDLASIYLECQDTGFSGAHQLSRAFELASFGRLSEVLDEAEDRFGGSAEIDSWRLQFRDRIIGDEIDEHLWRELADGGEAPLAQLYFHLLSGGAEFKGEMSALLRRVDGEETERSRYIRSLLTSRAK